MNISFTSRSDQFCLEAGKRLLAVSCVAMLALAGCSKARTASVYEIPEGFTGWVLIEFGNKNCPPLERKDGKHIIVIGSDGHFCTSSQLEYGWAKDTYFYVGKSRTEIQSTMSGGSGLIWGGSTGGVQTGSVEKTYTRFFVGTEEQFTNSAKQP